MQLLRYYYPPCMKLAFYMIKKHFFEALYTKKGEKV